MLPTADPRCRMRRSKFNSKWALWASIPRPPACKAGALPTELNARGDQRTGVVRCAGMTDGTMTREERETFLADVHVGVLAVDEPGRAPMALPIWYVYEDGTLVMNIHEGSRKAELVRAAGRATLTVQSEVAPYKYVCVEGPATVEPGWYDPLAMATRYLGPEIGQWYANENPVDDESITVKLVPERWRTWDFAKLFA